MEGLNFTCVCKKPMAPIFRRPISANPWLNFKPFFFFYLKTFRLLALKNVVLSDRPQLNCSVTAATSQHLTVGNCAVKLLPRASKAAQRFCIPLQSQFIQQDKLKLM